MSDYPTPHNFENAKNELKKFSQNLPSAPKFEPMEPTGKSIWGRFWGTEHNVTGNEVNEGLILPMQKEFDSIHNVQEGIVREFGTIFNTFESLDKEYISGIISNIEKTKTVSDAAKNAAEKAVEATQKAEVAQNDIKKTISGLQVTVTKLAEVKSDADKQISLLLGNISELNDRLSQIEKKISDSIDFINRSESLYDNVDIQKREVAGLKVELEKKLNAGPNVFSVLGFVFALISTILVLLHIFNVL